MQPDAGQIYIAPSSRHGTLNYGSLRRPPQQTGAAPPSVSSIREKPIRNFPGIRVQDNNTGRLVRANTEVDFAKSRQQEPVGR